MKDRNIRERYCFICGELTPPEELRRCHVDDTVAFVCRQCVDKRREFY